MTFALSIWRAGSSTVFRSSSKFLVKVYSYRRRMLLKSLAYLLLTYFLISLRLGQSAKLDIIHAISRNRGINIRFFFISHVNPTFTSTKKFRIILHWPIYNQDYLERRTNFIFVKFGHTNSCDLNHKLWT